jgi:hypothetical protein
MRHSHQVPHQDHFGYDPSAVTADSVRLCDPADSAQDQEQGSGQQRQQLIYRSHRGLVVVIT